MSDAIKGLCQLGLLAVVVCFGASCGNRAHADEDQRRIWEGQTRVVEAELIAPGAPPWAGIYYRVSAGALTGETLAVAPGGGFTYRETGCLGVVDVNWGAVAVRDETLLLSPALSSAAGVSRELAIVSWQGHVYLVPPESMNAFLASAESGSFGIPLTGYYLQDTDDGGRPVVRVTR